MNAHDELPEEVGRTEGSNVSASDKPSTESSGSSDRRDFLKKAYGAAVTVGLANFFVLGSRNAYASYADCPTGASGTISGGGGGDTCPNGDDYCPGGMDAYDQCAQDGGTATDECPGGTDLADKCQSPGTSADECAQYPQGDECNVATGSIRDDCIPTQNPDTNNPDECVNGENGEGAKDTCDDGGDSTDECPGGIGTADMCVDSNDAETDMCYSRLTTDDQCAGGTPENDACDPADAEAADVCPLGGPTEDVCSGPIEFDKCISGHYSTDECPVQSPSSDECKEVNNSENDQCDDPTISGSDVE